MKNTLRAMIMLSCIMLSTIDVRSEESAAPLPGLVAHYFKDPLNWSGQWPDYRSTPLADPADWTFTEYSYSRVEPVLNHLFTERGWFSVRWTGSLNVKAVERHSVQGSININPNNSDDNEFTMLTADGSLVTRDMLAGEYSGYAGEAKSIHVKPKGNGNQNSLTVDGKPYPLTNADVVDISAGTMTVKLYKDSDKAHGKWWIDVSAQNASVCGGSGTPDSEPGDTNTCDIVFEVHADDGCRLFIDGKAVINDWHAREEESPQAWRISAPVALVPGMHRIVAEYFQGQSLSAADRDPIVVYWSCEGQGVKREVIPASALFHSESDTKSSSR